MKRGDSGRALSGAIFSKSTALFLIALLTVVTGCAIRSMPGYQKNPPLPQVSGTLKVPGLNGEVKVYRDRMGVPHIMTENEHDLFFANGYTQAQDRLWQMILFRAVAMGRLSEIFGNIGIPGMTLAGLQLSTLEMDKYERVMGINYLGHSAEVMLAKKNPRVLGQIQAYCDGINAFIAQNQDRLPVEFQVLYFKPEPFRPADIVGLSRFYGLMLTYNRNAELTRYAVAKKYGEDMMWKLFPLDPSMGPTIVPKDMLKNRLPAPRELVPGGRPGPSVSSLNPEAAMLVARIDQAVRSASFFPGMWASNNWVVSPKLTSTGSAFMANDSHLYHMEPSLCYLVHLQGAGYDTYGALLPGMPYVIFGHNRHLSWGITVSNADVQDLFIEKIDPSRPGKYLYKGEWKDFTVRKEIIKIRPGLFQTGPDRRYKEEVLEIRSSIHGPIINDALGKLPPDTPPLALRWTGWDFSDDPAMSELLTGSTGPEQFREKLDRMDLSKIKMLNNGAMFDALDRGKSIQDFVEAMKLNDVTNMNFGAADSEGHIAYFLSGIVPVRKKGIGVMPVPGENGDYDWTGFVPVLEHPYAVDPERGFLVTANNRVVDMQWYPYLLSTNYSDGWRAWRIEDLLKKNQPLTMEKMKAIQNDVHSKQAEIFVPLILKAVDTKKVKYKKLLQAAQVLREWDLEVTVDSVGASIFYETMRHLVDRTLKDDFDKEGYDLIKEGTFQVAQSWVVQGQSEFFDDQRTRDRVEDVNDVLVGCLDDAVKWLSKSMGKDMTQWQWGKLHTIKWYHPMGFMALKDLSIGPFPHPGAHQIIRAASYMVIGKKYVTMEGPVVRHIMDMKDPDHAQVVIDGSQSGQWLSPHYQDMHKLWYQSEYLTADMNTERIKAGAESVLTLTPER